MLNQYQGVFSSLMRHDVRYVVIGGVAAVIHGVPRATFDLDMLVEATRENAAALLAAFAEAGIVSASLITPEELLQHEISIFRNSIRIDVQTRTPGLDFEEAWTNAKEFVFGDTPFYVVGRNDLIRAKRAAGRPIDLEDVAALERVRPGEAAE